MGQAEFCLWARPNSPTIGYGADQTDQRPGMGQTKQTDFRLGDISIAHFFSPFSADIHPPFNAKITAYFFQIEQNV